MTQIDWNSPIDATSIHNQKGTPEITGGKNGFCLTDCHSWDILNGHIKGPTGTPGVDAHAMQLRHCSNISITGTELESRGDPFNSFNSSNITLTRVKFAGKLFTAKNNKQKDIAADLVIDGEGRGGVDIKLNYLKLRRLVMAAGRAIKLFHVITTVAIQVGDGYPGNESREPYIIGVLDEVITPELYIHPKIKRLFITKKTCHFDAITGSEERIKWL